MITVNEFDRRLEDGPDAVEVHLAAHEVRWLDGQEHSGTNVGTTDTVVIFVELKEPPGAASDGRRLGPRG